MNSLTPKRSIGISVLWGLATLAVLPAAEIHVATNGVNATGRGSFGAPYLTIDYAADRANPGDIIIIRGGTYRETVTPSRSGTAQNPITYRPYNNEIVTLTGLDRIIPGSGGAGQWQLDTGSVYKIQLTANFGSDSGWSKERIAGNQVFVDGEAMSEARWPNAPTPMGIRRSEGATATSGYRSRIGDTAIFACGYRAAGLNGFAEDVWKDGIIVFVPGAGWYRRVATITGNTPTGANPDVRFEFNPYNEAENRENPNVGDAFFLMGRRIALDAEGEYFFDTIEGASPSLGRDGPRHMLYLRTPGSTSPGGRVVEMRRRQFAISLSNVSHLRFENIRVIAGRIRTTSNTSNCVFSNLTVEYPAYTWNEELGDDNESGVIIAGSGHQILDSTIRYSTGNGVVFPSGNNNTVRNSVVSDCFLTALEMKTSAGNIHAENVTFFNLGSSGIGANSRPSRVLYSHGYMNGLFATDAGLLNAGSVGDSLGSEWAYNWMHTALGVLNNSRDWYGTPAIRLDAGFTGDGPSNYLIHHNIAWNTTQPEKTIAIWALRGGDNPQTNFGDAKIRVYNNTVDSQIGLTETFSAPASVKGVDFRNNLTGVGINMNSSGSIAQGQLFYSDLILRNNVFPNRSFPNNPTPPHLDNRQGSPGWTAPSSPPFGYALAAASQAINTGTVIPGITDGFIGTAPDIGALEFGKRPFIPGAQVRAQDLAGLTVTPQVSSGTVRFVISGLPVGRTLPEAFQIKVGAAAASNDFALSYDFTNHTVAATFTAPSTPGGAQTVQFSLNGTTFVNAPSTVDVPDPGESAAPAGVVRATFIDGAGTGSPQQFPGTSGDGWTGGWQTTSNVSGTITESPSLRTGTGPALRITRTGGSGNSPQVGIFRSWSSATRPFTEFSRISFDLRLDSSAAVFNSDGDQILISSTNTSSVDSGGNSTFYIRTSGAPPGGTPFAPREWILFNGDPGVANGFDFARFVGSGMILEPGLTYSFTIDLYAGAGAGSTNGKTHGTYDVHISDGTRTVKVSNLGFRTGSFSAGGNFALALLQNSAADDLALSLDSVEMTAPVTSVAQWRTLHFTPGTLANASLESSVWGDLADPDGDTLPNILEYALDTDPHVPAVADAPRSSRDSQGRLTLTFLRARTGITYVVEGSDSAGGPWGAVATNPGTVGEIVTVTDTAPLSADRRFLRLRVTNP